MSNATIRVTFGNGASSAPGAHLSAQIDDRVEGLNAGKTSFAPGDQVWFLVYKSDNVQIDDVVPSAGSVDAGAAFAITLDQEVEFADSNTATLQVPAESITAIQWYGNSLGTPVLQPDKVTLIAPSKGIAVAKVSSLATAYPYRLTSPASIPDGGGNPLYDFSILVLVKGSVVSP